MKLFVGNLSWDATEELLRPLFEAYGKVVSVRIICDPYTGRSKGFGFVEMEDEASGNEAMGQLNDRPFLNRPLRVSQARQEQAGPRQPRFGAGAGGGHRRENGPRRFGSRPSHFERGE